MNQIIIVTNTIILLLDHYPQGKPWQRLQNVSEWVFTMIFATELAIKVIALGPKGYIRDPYNIIDGVLVAFSYSVFSFSFSFFPPFFLFSSHTHTHTHTTITAN